jgi:galacturan 1,4-alpha-galacturonidase
VTITDCSCTDCQNGVRIKTWPGGKGTVSGIKYDNIRLDSVQNPIIITTHYCDDEHMSECNADNAESLTISDVTINNIYGSVDGDSNPILSVNCSSSTPCSDFTITNINVTPVSGTPKNACVYLDGSSSISYC